MECEIKDVIIRELAIFDDERGWLSELFRHDELESEFWPVMSYISMTRPGVARGPHEHVDQSDLFCFLGPSQFRLYLWDRRADSSTRGKSFQGVFGEGCPALVIIPPGVVHAYKNIGEGDGMVFNAPNRLYRGEGKKEEVDEIRHEDDVNSLYKLD